MLRCYFLLLSMLLASLVACAQNTLPTARPVLADTAQRQLAITASIDTAAALHRLFAAERHKGRVTLTVCGIVAGVSGLAFAVKPDVVTLVAAGLLAVGSVVVTVPAAIQTIAYSRGREQRMLRAWQQHHLPRRVWRQLQPTYFQPGSLGEATRK